LIRIEDLHPLIRIKMPLSVKVNYCDSNIA
jgi:hypothetical protein